jgi:hypothetical protein
MHDVMQAEVYGHYTFWPYAKEFLIGEWEFLIPIFEKWADYGRSCAGKVGGSTTYKRAVGIFSEDYLKGPENADIRKRGGIVCGNKNVKLKRGIFSDEYRNSEKFQEQCVNAGRKAGLQLCRVMAECLVCGKVANRAAIASHLSRTHLIKDIDERKKLYKIL